MTRRRYTTIRTAQGDFVVRANTPHNPLKREWDPERQRFAVRATSRHVWKDRNKYLSNGERRHGQAEEVAPEAPDEARQEGVLIG